MDNTCQPVQIHGKWELNSVCLYSAQLQVDMDKDGQHLPDQPRPNLRPRCSLLTTSISLMKAHTFGCMTNSVHTP